MKSFENEQFLQSNDARIIRILCEFQEPAQRLRANGVRGTILFFGSARAMTRQQFDEKLASLQLQVEMSQDDEVTAKLQLQISKMQKIDWMCTACTMVEDLSEKLTQWAMTDPLLKSSDKETIWQQSANEQVLVVTTGGGPGMMEAANRGAARVPGAKTMGMGISLPFEKGLNPYVTDGLAFQFHYFFSRKFWLMYSARALVIAPGGFGTLDELFEFLTLRQTHKIADVPIVLLGAKYWQTVINWNALADFGVVSAEEVNALFFADTVDEAFEFIVSRLSAAPN